MGDERGTRGGLNPMAPAFLPMGLDLNDVSLEELGQWEAMLRGVGYSIAVD